MKQLLDTKSLHFSLKVFMQNEIKIVAKLLYKFLIKEILTKNLRLLSWIEAEKITDRQEDRKKNGHLELEYLFQTKNFMLKLLYQKKINTSKNIFFLCLDWIVHFILLNLQHFMKGNT